MASKTDHGLLVNFSKKFKLFTMFIFFSSIMAYIALSVRYYIRTMAFFTKGEFLSLTRLELCS